MKTLGVLSLICLLSLTACERNGGERVASGGDCSNIPVVEIAGRGATLATSCAEPFRFRGRRYWGSCFALHPSRVGSLVEKGLDVRSDYGGRTYTGVRRIKGVPLGQAFLPESEEAGCRPKRVPSYVAIAEDASDLRETFKRRLPDCSVLVKERTAGLRVRLEPCELLPHEEPQLSMRNVGEVRFAYGTPFKLERRVDGEWNWLNRRQAWDLPLFSLPPGKRASEAVYHWVGPTEKRLRTGLYRVTKELHLRNIRGPLISVRAFFRVLAK